MFTVYVIQNDLGYIYIGQTSNLFARLDRHNGIKRNKPKSFTSKHTGPWKVVYSESYPSRTEAMHREEEKKSISVKF
jgi:putative endonuclease